MFGVEALEVTETSQPDLWPCAKIAETKGCDGHITFELDVNEWGETTGLHFDGDTSPDLRTCLRERVTELVLLPAEDCRGTWVKGRIGGGITWATDKGTSVGFGHVAGIGGLCCLSVGPSGGPTNAVDKVRMGDGRAALAADLGVLRT
jgi:hypothetical protein